MSKNLTLQAAREAAQRDLESRAAAFLALHGYTGGVTGIGTLDEGTTSVYCPDDPGWIIVHYGHDIDSPGLSGHPCWRVDINHATGSHQTLFVRDGEQCPVLVFALAMASTDTFLFTDAIGSTHGCAGNMEAEAVQMVSILESTESGNKFVTTVGNARKTLLRAMALTRAATECIRRNGEVSE